VNNSVMLPYAYGFKTIPPQELVNIAEADDEAPPKFDLQDQADQSVPFIVSMQPIDRAMLESINSRWNLLGSLEKRDDHYVLLQHLFHNWDWAYTLCSNIVNSLMEPLLSPEFLTRERRYL
jgi:hypothetical protein